MSHPVEAHIRSAVDALIASGTLPDADPNAFTCTPPDVAEHGDYATNVALVNAKVWRQAPQKSAQALAEELEKDSFFEKVEVAGPGFVNMFLSDEAHGEIFGSVVDWVAAGCMAQVENPEKILLEFVSANPTGPLHVGHGRSAIFGDALARLLRRVGHQVDTEYYVNDLGRQMQNLGASLHARVSQELGQDVPLPEDGYQGDYMVELAKSLISEKNDVIDQLDDQAYIDLALNAILDGIREDLAFCGVTFSRWYSERTLSERDLVKAALEALKGVDATYEEEGALWFRSSDRGDEKDRVLVRSTGEGTYFSSDVAYHHEKIERGYDRLINVWGADHHGYVPRLRASIEALGLESSKLEVLLVQFVSLVRGGEAVSMSTRSGEFETFRTLVDEVGVDATRFLYLTRRKEKHLDFDLDLATQQSSENPVYYVQYGHARTCSVFEKAEIGDWKAFLRREDIRMALPSDVDRTLAIVLGGYRDALMKAAETREPFTLVNYLRELAAAFHKFYAKERILQADEPIRNSRLVLVATTRQVLYDGLGVLGVNAPESM